MLKYVWTVLLFLSIGIVNAQTNNQYINGIVLDEKAEPIIGASITVLEKDINTTSDVHGNFKFKEGNGHQHLTLRVSALGYETFEQPIHTEAGHTLKIVLKSISVSIDAVSVSAQQEEQKTAIKAKLSQQLIEE